MHDCPTDPRLTDYALLKENLNDLKEGKAIKVCVSITFSSPGSKTLSTEQQVLRLLRGSAACRGLMGRVVLTGAHL
jgi:hypothetical protein